MNYSEAVKALQEEADWGGKNIWASGDNSDGRLAYEVGFFRSRAAVLTCEVEALTANIRELENTLREKETDEPAA